MPVPETSERQTVTDAAHALAVPRQPGDRAHRAGREEEPHRKARPRSRGEMAREERGDGDAGQVVVRKRRMADVRGDEDLLLGLAGEQELTIGEMARGEGRIDAHLVVALGERQELPVRKAEAPALFV